MGGEKRGRLQSYIRNYRQLIKAGGQDTFILAIRFDEKERPRI